MALPFPIAASQTDAKSPVDDLLMDSIRLNIDYLDSQVIGGIVAGFNWNINGRLNRLKNYKGGLDNVALNAAFTPSACRVSLRRSGNAGSLKLDIRRITKPKIPIIEIANQYNGNTQSIANVAPGLATQSIQRTQGQISTQSISRAKAGVGVDSIIKVPGENLWRYNLDAPIDSDWTVGTSITIAGCTDSNNNGLFLIREVNQSDYRSIVVFNVSGVAQTAAAGSIDLNVWSYEYVNPVNSDFLLSGFVRMNGHTNAANDNASFLVRKINQSGNNIWIENANGVAQAAPAGTCDVLLWVYDFGSSTVDPLDFPVGLAAKFASHTTPGNNGDFNVVEINRSGNNIIVRNFIGAVQGSPAGTVNTNLWVYTMATDPSPNVAVNDFMNFASHSNANNNGFFQVVRVNRSGLNIVVFNLNGVAQGSPAGTAKHTKKIVKFEADQSSIFTTDSLVEFRGCPDGLYNDAPWKSQFQVLQVNRGGGSNYNIVILSANGSEQPSPAGYVITEMKSIFNTKPELFPDLTSIEENRYLTGLFTDLKPDLIPAETPLALFIEDMMDGNPYDLSVHM